MESARNSIVRKGITTELFASPHSFGDTIHYKAPTDHPRPNRALSPVVVTCHPLLNRVGGNWNTEQICRACKKLPDAGCSARSVTQRNVRARWIFPAWHGFSVCVCKWRWANAVIL